MLNILIPLGTTETNREVRVIVQPLDEIQSPCGRFIASPAPDKTIRIWDAKFSDAFYHKVTSSKRYPLAAEDQGLSYQHLSSYRLA